MNAPELSILMPVYNEADRVAAASAQVLATDFFCPFELIVVDDGSTDGTAEILDAYDWPANARLVRHAHNRGKGAAVRTGLSHARGTYAAILDADLEYDPTDIEPLVAPLRAGEANAAFGIRAFDGYSSHSFLYVLGNRSVTLAANVLFNVYLRDIMTCQKVIRTDVFRGLRLHENGFGIEAEIAARLVQAGERIFEVPAHYKARMTEEGKKLTSADGLRVLRTLARCRLDGGRGARSSPMHEAVSAEQPSHADLPALDGPRRAA